MMRINRIEKIRNEEIRARTGVVNMSEKIRETKLTLLGLVERKTEEQIRRYMGEGSRLTPKCRKIKIEVG